MIVIVDYLRAIKRPFTDVKKLIIGILLSIPIPFVQFITNNMAFGYVLNCAKNASEGSYDLPEWGNYGKLWVNSFVAAIINWIYLIPAVILFFVFARDLIIEAPNETALLASFTEPIGLISTYGLGLLFVWVVAMMVGYLTPIAMLNWIFTGKFGSAFDFRDIFSKVFTKKYLGAWLVLMIVEMGLGFIVLNFFTLDSFQDPTSIIIAVNYLIKAVVFLIILSIIGFVQNVFTYTVYGNVLEELKK